MRRVLITGASGFIGKAIVSAATDVEVLLGSREPSDAPNTVLLDLNQPGQVRNTLMQTRPDSLIHLAWQGIPDFSEHTNQLNLRQGRHLVEAALQAGCKHLVMTGSCMEYRGLQGSVSEEQSASEPDALADVKLKLLAQTLQLWPHRLVWLRPFYVYGEGQRAAALIPSVISSLKNGEVPVLAGTCQAHDFIDVHVVAEAVWRLLKHETAHGIFNIGTGQLRLVDQIKSWATSLWYEEPLTTVPQSPAGFFASTKRLEDATDWVPPDVMLQTLRQLITDAKNA